MAELISLYQSAKLGSGMRYRNVFASLLLALALCGCDREALVKKLTIPEQEQAARTYFEDIRTGNFAPVLNATDPSFRQKMTPAIFKAMRDIFGPKPVKSVTLVNAKVTGRKLAGQPGTVMHQMIYEYDMGDHFVIGDISLENIGHHAQIEGIHVQSLNGSIEKTNAFTLSGKSGVFFVFLALAILIPIFIIVTEIICWRTLIPRRKWLWRIFVLLGVTQFTLNWTSGDLQFLPVQINLLGAGFMQQPYGPIVLQIGVPLGAILFCIRRRKWLSQPEESAQQVN